MKLLCIGGPKHGVTIEMGLGTRFAQFPHIRHPYGAVIYRREQLQITTDSGLTVLLTVLVLND